MQLVQVLYNNTRRQEIVNRHTENKGVRFTHSLLNEEEVVFFRFMNASEFSVASHVVDHTCLTTGASLDVSILESDKFRLRSALFLDRLKCLFQKQFTVAVFSSAGDSQYLHYSFLPL
jgi:hypothetical protein